ncbi:cytochrome b5 domain-containing protein 1-like [Corticium candelabrum]|uniref:cytochrome b5 domain-containing protein 1-like n=1 Tax=Corticium candelabrum TaxID=121492 RepID=UPI002E26898D|nr:cytochrome b5 domain-containing protein 1-like [Corticium candelabrum]
MSRPKFFTPDEVSVHNTAKDIWVSFIGRVYDLTTLCEANAGDVLLKPILSSAGKDISHWFDKRTGELRTHIDSTTGCRVAYTPHGRFLHVPPGCPRSDWSNNFGRPWWKDERYCIGRLSQKTRKIKIVNMLTLEENTIEVCLEENMMEIQKRYFVYNLHAASYTWKYRGETLDMYKTLQENGISDEFENFYELNMDEDLYLPAVHLYFNDDLTEQ